MRLWCSLKISRQLEVGFQKVPTNSSFVVVSVQSFDRNAPRMAKQLLLTAVDESSHSAFLDLLSQHNDKRSMVDLGEVLTELSQSQLDKVWTELHSWATDQLNKLVGGSENDEVNNFAKEPSETRQSNEPTEVQEELNQMEVVESEGSEGQTGNTEQPSVGSGENDVQPPQGEIYNESILLGVVQFATLHISTIKGFGTFIPEKLLELAVLLHGMVSVLEGQLQEEIVTLCETWWHQELDERDCLITNVLPILIQMAIAKSGKRKNVAAVCGLRGALDVVEFDEPLVDLLGACVASPRFLSFEEGCRWLCELFTRQMLVTRLHRSVKAVLPECTRDQSAKYGEIYFRAWKKSTGDVQQMIEESCIQDLMYAAVHVDPLAGKLSTNLHHFLHQIHRNKRHHLVERMILKLYNPFLWRSLKVANGYVRMNATGLLCDAFPLSDSTCTLEERQELSERQYQTIISLLTDPCHLVRITAIKGTCEILKNYWLMIPSQVIKTIFQKFLTELLRDSSSAEVRTQVIKGLTLILDNNDAIPFMKEVLPRISDSFDDISVNVRIAFVHLLLKVKLLKIIKYWTIVPINHLLHGLEDDVPAVCKLLTQLLLNSFHPTQMSDHELLQRCLVLLKENRAAARRFYQYASRTLDLRSTVDFILLICLCIRNYIHSHELQHATLNEDHEECGNSNADQPASSRQSGRKGCSSGRNAKGKKGSRVQNENKENKNSGAKDANDNEEDSSPLDNPTVIGGLFDTIVILWSANAHRLAQSQNSKYLEALRLKVSKNMPIFFKFFKENKDVSQTLLYLASFLPKTLVPTLVGHCLSRLRSLQQDQDYEDSYVTYINALCNWNRVDDVLELATDWLVEGFHSATVTSPKERRLSRRGVHFHQTHSAQPSLALRLVRHVLQHPLNKLAALSKNRSLVEDLAETLKVSRDLLEERLNHSEALSDLCTDKFLCGAWSEYLSLVAVLHNPAPEKPAANEGEDEEEEGSAAFDSIDQLHHSLEWAARVLVPVLSSEEIGEKRKLRAGDDALRISTEALVLLVKTCNNLIIIGAADSEFVFNVCGFTDILLKSDACESFWEVSLLVTLEAYQYLKVYGTPYSEGVEGVTMPTDLLKSCIMSIADTLSEDRALPKEVEKLDKTLGMVLATLCQTRAIQNEVFQHLATTILDCLCTKIEKMKGVDSEIKTVEAMGSCVRILVGVCQSRVKLSICLMEALTNFIKDSAIDITVILAISHLLKVLSHDSGKVSRYSIKQSVGAIDSLLASILFPLPIDTCGETETPLPPTIYEEYAKTTREIVDELKSTLGIV
ncbi:condensin-2 complex subunit G2-like isoform X2 [Macrobrachium nipponense]|uniref:condensin-2 complex subunit G2-like isoform X2 n=1 Tax=Macrobrachium nipponense TaxID=159736 RepID=UPI0030C823CA